jgi:hypothetical protein
MLRERLTNDFSEALKNFQVIQRTAAQKEKESVIRARANSGLSGVRFNLFYFSSSKFETFSDLTFTHIKGSLL